MPVAARLIGFKPSGGRVEIFLERPAGERHALVQLRASKPIREELEVATEGGPVRVVTKEGDLWKVALPAPVFEFFERWGEVPLPPHWDRQSAPTRRHPLPVWKAIRWMISSSMASPSNPV